MSDEIVQTSSTSYDLVNIEQSNINASLLASDISNAIDEYCDIIVNTPIFSANANKDGIKSMLTSFFKDLYVTEPEDVLNYIGQKPSNKLINTLFERYGIKTKYIKNYPELLKTKTAYLLDTLTSTKGSVETFTYFNDILSEFYKDINFYKVVVDVKEKGNRYDTTTVLYKYFATKGVLNKKYANADGTYPSPNSIMDEDIELKFFISYNKLTNIVEYDVRLFDPHDEDIYIKFDTMAYDAEPIKIARGETKYIYKKLAFDTSAIKEYNKPEIISIYYNNPSYYDLTSESQMYGQKDTKIDAQILTYVTTYGQENKVRYVIDFGKAQPYDVKFAVNKLSSKKSDGNWNYNYITLKKGETRYDTGEIVLAADELEYEANDKQQTRSYNDLVFRLEPILINNPDNIETEVNSAVMLSRKFLMSKIDFFDQDVDNLYKRNVFPIYTNVIHMQLGASVAIDNTKMHPDLIRMYGMTYLNNNQVMKFVINNHSYKLHIQDYVDVLSFLKFKQLEITTGKRYENKDSVPYYYQYKLPFDKLKDIYDLHLYYMGMPAKYAYYEEFKTRFNNLLFTKNQQVIPTVKSMDDFAKYLKGTSPASLDELYNMIENNFPLSVNFADGRDQNLQLMNVINQMRYVYQVETLDEFFDILSKKSITDTLTTVSVYDTITSKFSIKYPRLVADIENIKTVDEIIEIYLYNYKVALEYSSKMDNLVEYFINDLYQLYIQSTAFKKRFFEPVLNLFEQYFFKAEQIYRSEQAVSELVKDKTNMILTDDYNGVQVNKDRVYSVAKPYDKAAIKAFTKQINKIDCKDKFTIDIINSTTKEIKYQYNEERDLWIG